MKHTNNFVQKENGQKEVPGTTRSSEQKPMPTDRQGNGERTDTSKNEETMRKNKNGNEKKEHKNGRNCSASLSGAYQMSICSGCDVYKQISL